VLADELDMTLHISPLMGMDQTYALRDSEPGERLEVDIESRPNSAPGGATSGPEGPAEGLHRTMRPPRSKHRRARSGS
jgi:hypothetical protein